MVNNVKLKIRFRRTTIFTITFVSFLAGLALARSGSDLHVVWLLFATMMFDFSWRRKALILLASALLLGVSGGILRGQAYLNKLQPYETLYGEELTVSVQADSDAVYADGGQLEFDASHVEILKPTNLKLSGKLQIRGRGVPIVYRGDIVEVSGKMYPTGGARQGRISFAEIRIVGRSGSLVESIRRKFVAGMQTALPEPLASFGLGILIGQRTTLPDDLSEQLSIVGLTHIIAVSGYNLTIIIRGVRRKLNRLSKYQSTVLSLVLMAGFLLLTGFSASIVRASIVTSLSLAAWYYGRKFKPLLLISLAAAMTAAWNPVYLWSDIGWRLSFLAFFGVLILAPLLKIRMFGMKEQKFLGQVVIESISAQIMVTPVILYIFSETSLIALASNAVIVPLVPFAMMFSVIAGVGGMLAPVLSGIFAWPGVILMTYMLDVVNLFSRIPYAKVELNLSLTGMLLAYGLILVCMLVLARKVRAKYGTITDKNIIE